VDGRDQFHQELGDRILPVEVIAIEGTPREIVKAQASPEFGAIVRDDAGLAGALDPTRVSLVRCRSRSFRRVQRTCWCISVIGTLLIG
jgi:hypothetical protein